MEIIKKKAGLIATLAICIFGFISIFLASKDSLTFDERAHIPASYSYVRYGDIRLNPEHPPLLKDLAGLPLLFLQPQFPLESYEWQHGLNEQWSIGSMFLNCSRPELACNDTWQLTFWSRLPLILVSLFLALSLFWWTRSLAGPMAGLLALTLMLGDPNMLAHNHLVTTDAGIAAFMFFSFYFFLKFLKNPSWKNTWLAGFFFTLVQLVKFSGVLLFPLFGIFIILYAFLIPLESTGFRSRIKVVLSYFGKSLFILFLYAAIVYVVYYFHTLTTPTSHIVGIAHMMFPERELGPIARNIIEYTSGIESLKPFAAYLLGVLMVFGRVAGGNTHYFLGTVQSAAHMSYFPVVFLTKETLPFLFLLVFTALYSLFRLLRNFVRPDGSQSNSLRSRFIRHIDTVLFFSFISMYSLLSIFGNLNIGFRHLFPILPFLYLWIAKMTFTFLKDPRIQIHIRQAFGTLVAILMGVQILIPFVSYPNYLSYYNELAGGTKNGYTIATDSNYDWGQDLGRLRDFIAYHNHCTDQTIVSTTDCSEYLSELPPIDTIRVDYFGGENIERSLGNRATGWWSERAPESGWYAISINTLQENWTTALNATPQNVKPNYLWLQAYIPVARAGQSIFIYYIP